MFKVPKKKKTVVKRSIRKETDDDEHDEDNSSSLELAMKQAKQKRKVKAKEKAKNSTLLSFNVDNEEHDDLDQIKNKKRQRGMGFGGMGQNETDNEEGESDMKVTQAVEDKIGPSSLYSKDQLEKLKSEQKRYDVPIKKEASKVNKAYKAPSKNAPSIIELPPEPSEHAPKPPEEDFISLETHILTGDEALKHMSGDVENENSDPITHVDKSHIHIKPLRTDSTMAKETLRDHMDQLNEEKENKSWEDEVARRAGISFHSDSVSSNIPRSKEKDSQLLSKVKETIISTLEHLKVKDNDIATKISHQKNEAESAVTEAKKNEDDLDSIGSIFEYYQQLRSDLVNWIGALRHLSGRISLIEEAIKDLLVEISKKRETRRREWEDDCIAILHKNGYLDRVIGRQPPLLDEQLHIPKVDEFGRDTQSLESLARAKRKSDRLRRQEESQNRKNDEMNDDMSDNEMMQHEERRYALADAVQVVLDEMNEQYKSLSELLKIFDDWKSRSEDDYNQCYASFALLHFVGIFIEAEISQSMDLACLIKESEGRLQSIHDFSWFRIINDSSFMKSHTVEEQKGFCNYLARNFLWDALKINIRGTKDDTVTEAIFALDILSKKQCDAVGKFYESLSHYCDDKSDKMASYFCAYIESYIQNFAVPILVQTPKLVDVIREDCDMSELIEHSTLKQLQLFGNILNNILKFFYPILSISESLGKFCLLDIIAYRVLPVFEASLTVYPVETMSELQSIYQSVKNAGLIDRTELMMASAPLRAAILRYGI